MRWINKTWQTHTDTHTKTRPKNLQTLHTFLGSRFKILGEASWIQALTVIQGPMSVSAWIQEVFPAILNLESQKFANFASFPGFKIQDSRLWEKLPESKRWLSSRAPCQSALGFKKFFPESWILNPKNSQTLQTFLDSSFKIQKFWQKLLESRPWLSFVNPSSILWSKTFRVRFSFFQLTALPGRGLFWPAGLQSLSASERWHAPPHPTQPQPHQ